MELLADPLKDRFVSSTKPPPHRPLDKNLMFPAKLKNKPDWKLLKDHLGKEGRVTKEDLIKLISDANKIFKSEGNILHMQDPLNIVGDIHGQYYDLVKMFDIGGSPENTKYLFLGDYVDRGQFSIECVILLYALKICFPQTVILLRGNHECRQMTSFFNFRSECLYKYDQEIYDIIMSSFDLLPLICIVNGKFLSVHGGLSPDVKLLDEIEKLDRFKEPPRYGVFCDLLWSDPVENDDGMAETAYRNNEVRGCSYFYGAEAANNFLERNALLSVIRGHEAQIEGYKMHTWNGSGEFPVVITVFSAPNYCDVYNNKGAIIKFDNNSLNIQQFNYTTHPYLLPNFMDIFTWSIPFVAEKVSEILYGIIKPKDGEVFSDEDISDAEMKKNLAGGQQLSKKGDILRNKIKFVSKMVKLNKTIREESESLIRLKGLCPDSKIPKDLLKDGPSTTNTLEGFNTAKRADSINEKRPDVAVSEKKGGGTSPTKK